MPGASTDSTAVPASARVRRRAVISTSGSSGTWQTLGDRLASSPVRLNSHAWGDEPAPLVMCVHGVTGHGMRFRKLAEERLVPAGFRVVSVDLRGHGRSGYEPPWNLEAHVEDLLETLAAHDHGDGVAVWIGHSFGGRLVMEVAAREPERLKRAVLLDPAIQLDPRMALDGAEECRLDQSFESPAHAIR